MKKISRIVLAAIAVETLFACNNLKENTEPVISFEKELVFTASREGFSTDTKTVRMDDGSTWWNASEEISVFYGSGADGGRKFTSTNTAPQEIVEFDGSIQRSDLEKEFWAVYPYSEGNTCDGSSITTVIPAVQTGVEGNFSGDSFPVIAKSNTRDMAFWNICGGIKFSVTRNDIKSVTIEGKRGESLAGKIRVSFDANGIPIVSEILESVAEVTIFAPNGGTFKPESYYYFTLLPSDLNNGFTITLNADDARGLVDSNRAQTIKRSIFGVLNNVDSQVAEWITTGLKPESVDLGLSVKWATLNVGATSIYDCGYDFAWGETQRGANTSWNNYKWAYVGSNGSYDVVYITKYHAEYVYAVHPYIAPDYKIQLDPEDDAAYVYWGDPWRMPTKEEWAELLSCNKEWGTVNGIQGETITSNIPGFTDKSIFIPVGSGPPAQGGYWASTRPGDWPVGETALAYCAYFGWYAEAQMATLERYFGCFVRPVDGCSVCKVILNNSELFIYTDDTILLEVNILPKTAKDKGVTWASSNDAVATVSQDGLVTAIAPGVVDITVTSHDGNITASCEVTVYEPVDLGLSVKWAVTNLGANKPEEYGNYYSWGESAPKSNYSESTYKWFDSSHKLTKYNANSSYGTVDNKNQLDNEDDAVIVSWGERWRMPTYTELKELRENCTWTWMTLNGVTGYLVTSKITGFTTQSIFLPAGGCQNETEIISPNGEHGYYWSSSLAKSDYAYGLVFDDPGSSGGSYRYIMSEWRTWGFLIRPVCPIE